MSYKKIEPELEDTLDLESGTFVYIIGANGPGYYGSGGRNI